MKTVRTVFCALLMFGSGCSMMQMGKDLGDGLGEGLGGKADTIGSSLVRGMRDTLTGPVTRGEIDTLLTAIGKSLAEQARRTRDTLLGNATRAWIEELRDSVMGARTQAQLAAIRNVLIGSATQGHLAALRTELLGDSTQRLIGAMRNQLLGAETKAEVAAIVDTAMSQLAMRFGTDVKPLLNQELTFVQKNASILLVILGVLACVVVAFVYRQKYKMLQLIRTLTFQIHTIPDQHSYDELVNRIQTSAQQAGLEPHLRKILADQGLLGKDAWRSAA